MSTQIIAAFAVYFTFLLAIGLVSHKKQKSSADFIVGNRSLNFWLTALSAHASDMSAWLFMGLPSAILIGGLSQSWIGIGLAIGMFLNWQLVAIRLRKATEKYDSYTLSTFFERRFNDRSGILRVLTATMAVAFLTCYLAAGLIAMGLLLESVFGIDYYVGLSVAMLVAVSYTFSGGFLTIAWTDLFQALFLLCVIIFVPIIAFGTLQGGVSQIETKAFDLGISFSLLPDYSLRTLLMTLFLILGWGLGYFGQPHIITKFMGIRDANDLKKAKWVGMGWQVLALTASISVGLIGIAFFSNGLANTELVFVEMVKTLFHPFIAGLILCAVLAANISTMDSQILVCASVLSEDFYKHIVRKEASQRDLVRASRAAVVIVSVVSLLIAFNRSSTVLETVLYAWAGLGCCFGPLTLMALYSKSANRYGAIAGILVGGLIAGGWETMNPYITDINMSALIPGFPLSLLSIYLVSMLTGGCNEKHSTKNNSSTQRDDSNQSETQFASQRS